MEDVEVAARRPYTQVKAYTFASHGKIGSRPTHSGGTSRSCVISRQRLPGWRRRPVRDAVFGRGVAARGLKVREVRDDDHRIVDARPSPLPDEDALAVVEIDMDELGVVDRQRIGVGAKLDQPGDVVEHAPAPRLLQAIEVDRVDLLLRVPTGRSCSSANSSPARIIGTPTAVSRQTKASLIRFSVSRHAVVVEEVVQPLVAEALDVVRGDVVDRLRDVGEAEQAAVDQLADRPLEARLLRGRSGPGSRSAPSA